MRAYLLCFTALLLTACQQPTTYGPKLNADEVERERALQRDMTTQAQVDRKQESQEDRLKLEQRLLRVSGPVARAGAQLCAEIRPADSSCVFDFQIEKAKDIPGAAAGENGGGINAYADGEHIFVTPAMMRFTDNDEELALVLSHEMAHNIMGHISSKRTNSLIGAAFGLAADVLAASQGVNTQGGFTQLGSDVGGVSYSTEFEQEADYVGLYIMSRSGYKVDKATQFWRRFSARVPASASGGITHPANAERFVAMEQTITEIDYKRKHHIALHPDFKPET